MPTIFAIDWKVWHRPGNKSGDTDWIKEYFAKIGELSQTKIRTFSQSDPAAELSKLETADQAVFSGMLKGRAKLPTQDLVAFADANLNLGVADGNLLGRRLVFWPDLALQDRQRLHDELSTTYVTLDEDEQNNLASDPEAAPSALQDGLMDTVVEAGTSTPIDADYDRSSGCAKQQRGTVLTASGCEFQSAHSLSKFCRDQAVVGRTS